MIAKASNYVFYANGNKDSQALISKEVLEDPAIYPTEETVKKLYTTTTKPPKINRVQNRIWTKVKTGS